jgi:hypothetical protein
MEKFDNEIHLETKVSLNKESEEKAEHEETSLLLENMKNSLPDPEMFDLTPLSSLGETDEDDSRKDSSIIGVLRSL